MDVELQRDDTGRCLAELTSNGLMFKYHGYICFITERADGTWHSNVDGGCGPQRSLTLEGAIASVKEDVIETEVQGHIISGVPLWTG